MWIEILSRRMIIYNYSTLMQGHCSKCRTITAGTIKGQMQSALFIYAVWYGQTIREIGYVMQNAPHFGFFCILSQNRLKNFRCREENEKKPQTWHKKSFALLASHCLYKACITAEDIRSIYVFCRCSIYLQPTYRHKQH